MKERVNKSRARTDLSDVALLQQEHVLEQNFAGQKIRVDFAILLKSIMAMNAAAQQYLKGAGESMLVYGGRAIQPEIDIHIKSWSIEESDRRITKIRLAILLARQFRGSVNPANNFPWVNLSR